MRKAAIGTLLALALGVTACETYSDGYGYRDGYRDGGRYGDYSYAGADYDRIGNDCGYFDGEGADLLDPWLACTDEGHLVVRNGFDEDSDRRITAETADRANIWFRRHADTDRDLRLTDNEIRGALVNAARYHDGRLGG